MADLMALGIAIQADSAQALSAFKGLETAGRQTASVVTTNIAQATAALNTLGIAAKTASIDGIDKIVVSGAQLEQTNAILARMGGGLQAVEIQAKGAAKATEQVATAAKASTASYQKWGNAAIRGAGALMLMGDAMSGNDKSMQKILKTGSSIAFMFGPTGAIVGSIGIATSMIIDMATKAADAAEKVREEWSKTMAKLRVELSVASNLAEGQALEAERRAVEAERAALIPKLIAAERGLELALASTADSANEYQVALKAAQSALKGFQDEAKAAETRMAELDTQLAELHKLTSALATAEYNRDRQMEEANRILDARAEATKRLIEAEKELARSRAAQAAVGAWGAAPRARPGAAGIQYGSPDVSGAAGIAERNQQAVQEAMAGLREAFEKMRAESEALAAQTAEGIRDAIVNGFSRAFSGEGMSGLLKGFASGFLASLGAFFIDVGKSLIAFGAIMVKVREGLMNLLKSGPAAIVGGIALIALGAAMGAAANSKGLSGGGSSGGGGGGSSARGGSSLQDIATRYSFNPTTGSMKEVNPVAPVYFTIIGQNDVDAQNRIADMVVKAQRRGGGRA